jgi:hypothetical protein
MGVLLVVEKIVSICREVNIFTNTSNIGGSKG